MVVEVLENLQLPLIGDRVQTHVSNVKSDIFVPVLEHPQGKSHCEVAMWRIGIAGVLTVSLT